MCHIANATYLKIIIRIVIPARSRIWLKRLDSPVSGMGQAYQVRNDDLFKVIYGPLALSRATILRILDRIS